MDAASALDQFLGEVDETGKALKDRTKARFEDRPRLDKQATEENGGNPVYKETLYVIIKCPKKDPNDFVAKDHHIKRFPRAYQEYLNMKKAMDGNPGTPMLEWNGIPATKARELYGAGILTVEQLAEADLTDKRLSKEVEFFQKSAIRYLQQETAKDEEIARLKAQLAEKSNDTTDNSTKRSRSGGGKAPEQRSIVNE